MRAPGESRSGLPSMLISGGARDGHLAEHDVFGRLALDALRERGGWGARKPGRPRPRMRRE